MQIKRLRIEDHLCLVDFDIEFNIICGGSSTILIGENGTGKTTMIEAVLEILMSFDSPSIESQLDYNYEVEFEYAQSPHFIAKEGHRYRIVTGGEVCEGAYKTVRGFIKRRSMFPQRIIAFYSGTNNKMAPAIAKANHRYHQLCRETLTRFLRAMGDDSQQFLPNFPKRKYNYCEENLTPVYLVSILCGRSSFEKEYLKKVCRFKNVEYINMVVNVDKVEKIFGRGRFEGNVPTNLYYLTDFIDERFTDSLRKGFQFSAIGKSYFEMSGIESLEVDAITILEFFEKLYSLFDARFEVTVTQGASNVKCSKMSEGQRQLIKILGMLGICKSEDCLVLMDEPDVHMNPKWKYEIKDTMDKSLSGAINTQAIIATHDPLVVNGVSKEFIRIFSYNQSLAANNEYYFTKVITPIENTEGLGIDGLLQSEYYGMASVLDSETKAKMDKKHDLLVKKQTAELNQEEQRELHDLSLELENLTFARNIPTDSYYGEYVAAMHKLYRDRLEIRLTAEDIAERNAKAEEILRKLLEK